MRRSEDATELFPGVVVDPDIIHGVPVIKGTRIPVRLIIGHLAAGDTVDTIMEAYRLTDAQVRTALGYAAERLEAETVYVMASQ